MNIIAIMLDSFRQDHIGTYNGGEPVFDGITACRTPNLDRFAQECIVFDNAYPEALPTLPVRTQFFTGQRTLPYRYWQPLTKEDITIAEILGPQGYTCGLISDCHHYRKPGMNFHRGFDSYRWVRGQEYDRWMSHKPRRDPDDYMNEHYGQYWRTRISQFLANTDDFTSEDDWFPAKVVRDATGWLKRNREHEKIFLWIDSFDPHEPWDPPARFDTYTDPDYDGKRLILPMGGMAKDWATPAEERHVQGLYAGEAAFVDHCLGTLFKALKDLGYYDDSVILLTADHGHPLGDHGKFLKGTDRMYSELLKVPFMIRLPGGEGARRTQAIVQFHDALPTLLSLLGMTNSTSCMQGRSFLPVLKGDSDDLRDVILTGYHESVNRSTRDKIWSYVQRPEGEPDELYNLVDDPRERQNLIDEHPEEARRLAGAFGGYFQHGAPKVEIKGLQGKYELGLRGTA